MTQKVSATARCQYCAWAARHSGENVIEVATFLRRLCIEHTETMHADEHNARVAAAQQKTEDKCDSSK